MLAEPFERTGPEVVQLFQPPVDLDQPVASQRVVALAAVAAFGHDAYGEHEAQVLRHRGAADGKSCREIARPPLRTRESCEQLAPNRVSDHAEGVLDDGSSRVRHAVTIRKENLTCQA